MKYGLITFKDTENIGDDIQSYSAIRFLPHIDYYIEREKLDCFIPKKKEQVVTLMNGWFLHSKINFLCSPYIFPIFISTHISGYEIGGIKLEYLNDYSIKKLKKYEPIGCRDSETEKILTEKGLKTFYSGCLTLSLKKDKNIKKENKICLVDVDKDVEKYIKENLKEEKIIKCTHTLNKSKNRNLSWDERFQNVKKLLDKYQSSKLVITSRLHCALPCLALGTPVILLYDPKKEYTKDRLADYSKIITSLSTKQFLERGIDIINQGVTNPKDYLKIRNSIEKKVKKLLEEVKTDKEENIPTIEFYKEYYVLPKENIDYLYQIVAKKLESNKRENIENKYAIDYWKKEFNKLLVINNPQEIRIQREQLTTMIEKCERLCMENNYLKQKLEKKQKRKNY